MNPNNEDLRNKYKAFRNKTTALIRETKTQYYARQIEKTPLNSKEMWKILKENIDKKDGKKNNDPAHIKLNGKQYDNVQEIVEIFNHKYINIADILKKRYRSDRAKNRKRTQYTGE